MLALWEFSVSRCSPRHGIFAEPDFSAKTGCRSTPCLPELRSRDFPKPGKNGCFGGPRVLPSSPPRPTHPVLHRSWSLAPHRLSDEGHTRDVGDPTRIRKARYSDSSKTSCSNPPLGFTILRVIGECGIHSINFFGLSVLIFASAMPSVL